MVAYMLWLPLRPRIVPQGWENSQKKHTHTHIACRVFYCKTHFGLLRMWPSALKGLDEHRIQFNRPTHVLKLSCLTKLLVPYNSLLLFRVNSWIMNENGCTNEIPSARLLHSQKLWKHATYFKLSTCCVRLDCVTRHIPKARHNPLETYYNSLVDELPTLELTRLVPPLVTHPYKPS
jgi:hypothetical protein